MAKVLVVEDDLRLKVTYDILLTKEGHVVERAVNGQEALQKLETFQPDLILLDLMMPKMTGLEFLEAANLRASHPGTKVIVFSNLSSPGDMRKAYDLGATKFMVKSTTSPKQLATVVEQTLASGQ